MRRVILALMLTLGSIASASAQVSVSIGINLPSYPQLVRVPSYPVYYAPGVNGNFFFYDGLYWVYEGDNWYESSWYNGPWALVEPSYVPVFVLRIPVRYYRSPPVYFRDWQRDAPPRWGDRWGRGWEGQHRGWDRWNRSAAPAPAPLPVYQRQYAGNRYPPAERQRTLQDQNYRYQPRDAVVRQHFQQSAPPPRPDASPRAQRPAPQNAPRADVPPPPRAGAGETRQASPAPRAREDQQRPGAPVERAPQGRPVAPPQAVPHPAPAQREAPQNAPRADVPPPAPRTREGQQRPAAPVEPAPQGRPAAPPQAVPHPAPAQREAPAVRAPADRGPGPAAPAPQGAGRGQEKGQEKDRGRGPDKKD